MRKLDYLRNRVKKCKCYDDLNSIKLPSEFRWKKDIGNPSFYTVIDVTTREVNFRVIHTRWIESLIAKPTRKYIDPSIETEYEEFKIYVKKDFDLVPKGLKGALEDTCIFKK